MSAIGLGSRAIIGEFYKTLEQNIGQTWIPTVSNLFTSDQESEEYRWLGMVPQLREWVGGRQAKGFRENGISIKNLPFEATLEVLTRELRRDKTGQIMVRVRELAKRANSHWASLISTLILNGATSVCYDGQYFFDTDHNEGASGNLSNKIDADISAYPMSVHGTVTAPSPEEMQWAIMAGIQQLYALKDDQGEPMNEMATNFLVMIAPSLWKPAQSAIYSPLAGAAASSMEQIKQAGLTITPVVNARLSSWTDKFVVFRADSEVKPFIRQEEKPIMMKAIADGSELEFNEEKHHYGISAYRNVGYGLWQHACQVTMV